MAVGVVTLFNLAKPKALNGVEPLTSASGYRLILCNSSQALAATFAGASTDCRYADLTGELSTANGYTVGGITLSSVTLSQASGTVTFNAANPTITLTGSITFKYGVICAYTNTNKDLLGFFDVDTSGGTNTQTTPGFNVNWGASGILTAA